MRTSRSGGRHAWEWLQPVVGHPIVTVALDHFYHLGWSLLVLGALALIIVSPQSALRRKYATASVLLLFLVGTLVALALSSAGPPYYDHVVYGPDPYARLFAYLGTVGKYNPLISSGGRDVLWSAYRHGVDAFGLGISAMPSMHVATATLVACLAFAVGLWLGIVASLCTVLMAIASIALGWHYSLDGYVGALLAIVVWWIAGWMERMVAAQSLAPSNDSASAWRPLDGRLATANLRRGLVAVGSANEQGTG
jgi:membrane-associated phospholipid phosphatase